ncbi:Mitogen-activated protein kinase kinase 1 [Diplonema papillatum]|nr:Mitogen-activated protein kinase kinase 1 [Diplonema papillatum]
MGRVVRRPGGLDLPAPQHNGGMCRVGVLANVDDFEEGVVAGGEVRFGSDTSWRVGDRPTGAFMDPDWLKDGAVLTKRPPTASSGQSRKSTYDDLIKGRIIGKGVFGEVHRVVERNTGKVFALKSVNISMDDSVKAELSQLVREKRSSIVWSQKAWYSRSRSTVTLQLEYMCFGSLKNIFANRRAAICHPGILCVAKSVGTALQHLREEHAIHRDVKPANILVGAGGVVKLADFGISRLTDQITSLAHTGIGTTNYMAPERLNNLPYSYPADVFALGLVLGWLYMGGVHPMADAYPFCENAVRLPHEAPEELSKLVHSCTEPNPSDRLTAGQMLAVDCVAKAPGRLFLCPSASKTTYVPLDPSDHTGHDADEALPMLLTQSSDELEQGITKEYLTESESAFTASRSTISTDTTTPLAFHPPAISVLPLRAADAPRQSSRAAATHQLKLASGNAVHQQRGRSRPLPEQGAPQQQGPDGQHADQSRQPHASSEVQPFQSCRQADQQQGLESAAMNGQHGRSFLRSSPQQQRLDGQHADQSRQPHANLEVQLLQSSPGASCQQADQQLGLENAAIRSQHGRSFLRSSPQQQRLDSRQDQSRQLHTNPDVQPFRSSPGACQRADQQLGLESAKREINRRHDGSFHSRYAVVTCPLGLPCEIDIPQQPSPEAFRNDKDRRDKGQLADDDLDVDELTLCVASFGGPPDGFPRRVDSSAAATPTSQGEYEGSSDGRRRVCVFSLLAAFLVVSVLAASWYWGMGEGGPEGTIPPVSITLGLLLLALCRMSYERACGPPSSDPTTSRLIPSGRSSADASKPRSFFQQLHPLSSRATTPDIDYPCSKDKLSL